MRAYFEDLVNSFTSPAFLDTVRTKYHYQKDDMETLCLAAERMFSSIKEEAGWEYRVFLSSFAEQSREPLTSPSHIIEEPEEALAEVSLTLGAGVDRLQEQYLSQGLLTEGYMVESLSSELLLQGYGAYNRAVEEETPYHVRRYHFLGSEAAYPIQQLKGLLQRLEMPVTCNEAYCMVPKKSVAFVAELTREQGIHCQGICVGCRSANCPNRMEEGLQLNRLIADMTDVPLSYGYSRIFGRR